MEPTKKVSPAIIILIAVVLVGIVAGVAVIANQPKEVVHDHDHSAAGPDTTKPPLSTNDKPYKDGTYTETGNYISPGGAESVDVTITITNDIITDASVTAHAASAESKEHQDLFISGYKAHVVGKDIDTVGLSRVAGSSLTSDGFNKALELIKADAQA